MCVCMSCVCFMQSFASLTLNLQKTASNRRTGQDHPQARLTDHDVDLIRRMHEADGWGYKRLAKKFEVSRHTIRDICTYRYR